MPIAKLLGITAPVSNPVQINREQNFVKNSFEFGQANPYCPESRDEIHGNQLYCLA